MHVFNIWYYRVSSNNTRGSYFKISLGQWAKSRGNREEVQRENIATLNHSGICNLSINKNS